MTHPLNEPALSLFAASRRTDPPTSFEAARNVEASGCAKYNREKCLNAVKANPGRTAAEIAVLCGLERHEPSRRLPELCRVQLVSKGMDRKCNVTGNRSLTWWPVERFDRGKDFEK